MAELSTVAFVEGLNELNFIFPGINGKTRAARYYEAVKDLTEAQWGLVIDEIIDTCKPPYPPVPKVFREVALRHMTANNLWQDPDRDREDPRDAEKMRRMLEQRGAKNLWDLVNKGWGNDEEPK